MGHMYNQIKDIKMNDLQSLCVDLLAKSFLELRQKTKSEELIAYAQILSDDLKQDFEKLTFEDIVKAFREGVRNTDDFLISVKTYYKWIKAHRQNIWDNVDKPIHQIDKRLKYRTRKGTGIKKISINKNLIS